MYAKHHDRCQDVSGGWVGEKTGTQQAGTVKGAAGMVVQTQSKWTSPKLGVRVTFPPEANMSPEIHKRF